MDASAFASYFAEASVFARATTDKTADLKATARLGDQSYGKAFALTRGPSHSTVDKRYWILDAREMVSG